MQIHRLVRAPNPNPSPDQPSPQPSPGKFIAAKKREGLLAPGRPQEGSNPRLADGRQVAALTLSLTWNRRRRHEHSTAHGQVHFAPALTRSPSPSASPSPRPNPNPNPYPKPNLYRYSAKYAAGVTDSLDSSQFARLREEILSPQDKAAHAHGRVVIHPNLAPDPNPNPSLNPTKVGISESILAAISEENARLAQTSDVRNDPKLFVAALDKVGDTLSRPTLLASTLAHAHPPAVAATVRHRGDAAEARPTNGRGVPELVLVKCFSFGVSLAVHGVVLYALCTLVCAVCVRYSMCAHTVPYYSCTL